MSPFSLHILILDRSTLKSLEPELAPERLQASLQQAIAERDPLKAAGLGLAARLRTTALALDAEQLEWLLLRVDDPAVAAALVGCCREDPLPVLERVLLTEPPWDVRLACFWTSAILLKGEPPSPGVVTAGKRALRDVYGPYQAPLQAVCFTFANQELRIMAEELGGPLRSYEGVRRELEAYLRGDFERYVFDSLERGPVRRRGPKVGSNDPCPCGSGKKFKRCCRHLEATSHEPYRRPQVSPRADLQALRLHELILFPREQATTMQLELLLEEFCLRGPLQEAEEILSLVLRRRDLEDHADQYRLTVLREAAHRGDRDRLHRLAGELTRETHVRVWTDLLFSPAAQALERSFPRILDQPLELSELAYLSVRFSPVLALLLSRSVITLVEPLETTLHFDLLRQIRAELGRPEEDPIEAVLEKLHQSSDDSEEANNELASQVRDMQKELAEARKQLKELEAAEHKRLAQPVRNVLPPPPDPELKRMRERMEEIQGLLRERNQERAQLRNEVERHRKLAQSQPAPTLLTADPQPEPAPESQLGEDPSRYPPLIPCFSSAARDDLKELPVLQARQALTLAGELAAGKSAAWRKVKRLHQTQELFSARLGLHHRLLFRLNLPNNELWMERMIPRESQERVLKSWTH